MSSVCLSVCNVLYCGETVRPSEKVSEGVNRKQLIFWVAAIFLLPVSYGRPLLALAGFLVKGSSGMIWLHRVKYGELRSSNSGV